MAEKAMPKRPARPPRDAALSFRMPRALRAALEKAALADDRTVSVYVTRMIERELRATGFLPEEKRK